MLANRLLPRTRALLREIDHLAGSPVSQRLHASERRASSVEPAWCIQNGVHGRSLRSMGRTRKSQARGRRTGCCLSIHDGPNVATVYGPVQGSTSWGDFRTARRRPTFEKGINMLWTIAVILFVLWVLGLVTSYTMGGLVHILLILAVVAVVVRLIQGRKVLP